MSPIVSQLLTALESLLTTGKATIGPISASEPVDLGGAHYSVTESVTVDIAKQ